MIKLFNKYSYSCSFNFIVIILTVTFLQTLTKTFAFNSELNETSKTYSPKSRSSTGRSLLKHTDEYVARNQKQCVEARSLISCIKYKASKIVWKFATNSMGYFPNEYGRDLREDRRRIRFIQLGQPADEIIIFNDGRSLEGDNEITHIGKFLKRAVETFGQNHGIQLMLTSDSGARITTGETGEIDYYLLHESYVLNNIGTHNAVEPRGLHEKKKRKWLIILPLIILMKIAHLKMTLVTLLLGVLGLNVLLVGGVGWLIHYLKFKTLCKIHPQLVQHHSHVYDSDPADYSQFVGSSFPGTYYSSAGNGPHEVGGNFYSKDWSTSKAYNGYNYLDTISKRLK